MSDGDTLAEVIVVLRSMLETDVPIDAKTQARDVPGWDSMAHIGIIAVLEEQFGLRFSTSELELAKRVGDLAAIIDRKLAAR